MRISVDATAPVKVGPFSRGGKSRSKTEASDHDCTPKATVPPVGIVVPTCDAVFLYGVCSKVTSACIADCRTQWWESVRERFGHIAPLTIHLDNGPENPRRRPQCMQRIVDFVHHDHLHVRFASYPPYHSTYNPVERCWGMLENHWNGALLDAIETVVAYAQTMTWKGIPPGVELVTTPYKSGVQLTKQAMHKVEKQLQRYPGLEKWFVDIYPPPNAWVT